MAREIEEPKLVKEDHHGKSYEHPAFGQIRASRVSGHAVLYGSDFVHQGFVTITISTSQLQRTLAREWYFGKSEVIEVALSEAQWATFVSSMNMGSGVPCTIERQAGVGLIPGLPPPAPTQNFKADVHKAAAEALEAARTALVLTVAFLGRDNGTDRIEHTTEQIIDVCAKAETGLRALRTLKDRARG